MISEALKRCGSDCIKDEVRVLFSGPTKTQSHTACTTMVGCTPVTRLIIWNLVHRQALILLRCAPPPLCKRVSHAFYATAGALHLKRIIFVRSSLYDMEGCWVLVGPPVITLTGGTQGLSNWVLRLLSSVCPVPLPQILIQIETVTIKGE